MVLKTLRPSLSSVKDGENLEAVAPQAVGDDIWGVGHDEFASPGHPARAPGIRKCSQPLDGRQDGRRHAGGGVRVLMRDVRSKVGKVIDRAPRPLDDHPRGAFRSRVFPHDRSHAATSL